MTHALLVAGLLLTALACSDPYVNEPYKPDPTPWLATCGDTALDWQDATCPDANWQMPTCTPVVAMDAPEQGHDIVALPAPLTYAESPPLSGNHRPDWARWGEYAFLPPQRWVYNLQLGGVVVLYNPCVAAPLVETLRQFLRDQPADATGAYRWVLTPYPNLKTPFALVTWRHSLSGNCFDPVAALAFVQAHYRQAPEDNAAQGAYAYAWIGKAGYLLTGPVTADGLCLPDTAPDAQ